MGEEVANKMLHADWPPTAQEAKEIGLVTEVVPHANLETRAQELAESWIAEGNLKRTALGYDDFDNLRAVNAQESKDLAQAFVSVKFLQAQVDFLTLKKKDATMFKVLLATRPLWSKFL
jgi:enoyl-CoA hydratase/carnithine racemase